MPNVYNKSTGERINCEKEQVKALLKGNYSLTKPELDEDAQDAADEKKAEEKKANEKKASDDKVAAAAEAKKKQIQKDQQKVPGKK